MDYVHTPSAIEAVKATPKSSKTGYAETWDPTSAAEVSMADVVISSIRGCFVCPDLSLSPRNWCVI